MRLAQAMSASKLLRVTAKLSAIRIDYLTSALWPNEVDGIELSPPRIRAETPVR
jgi:hypothetical protein